MKIKRYFHLTTLAIALATALLVGACTGDQGAVGPAGPQGPAGQAGAQGSAGDPAPTSVAGIRLDKAQYVIGKDKSFKVTGWGFKPGESVLIKFHTDKYGPGIVAGQDVNAYGTFEVKPAGRFRMQRIKQSAGTYTVWAEGSLGSRASAPIVLVDKK